jgi:hypothetical protein
VLWKIPLYFAFLFKRQKQWVRTERDASNAEVQPGIRQSMESDL